eukprot:snap_masked-scaffold_1-processed-gene-24.36-mRNA-1 protein AED:1.00 eAED:1.00 QI:0/-1/0/0/-1/1/1/0/61
MSIDLTKSATEMIHEAASGRNPVVFTIIKQNFDVEKVELTKKSARIQASLQTLPKKDDLVE